jgi:ABC-type transport system involved in multi-copper enzyme maturation permease subunit
MRWLIWKEYRENRLILGFGVVLLLVPYAMAGVTILFLPEAWMDAIFGAAFYSVCLSQVVLALLGGNAIAGERTNRSAEFLGYLPISRWRNLVSRLVLAPVATAVIWCVNGLILWLIFGSFPKVAAVLCRGCSNPQGELAGTIAYTMVTGLTFFCVGWLFSSLLSHAVLSAVAGMMVPLTVFLGLLGVDWLLRPEVHPFLRHDDERGWFVAIGYFGLCLVLSLVSFVVGTILYLRRVEP